MLVRRSIDTSVMRNMYSEINKEFFSDIYISEC